MVPTVEESLGQQGSLEMWEIQTERNCFVFVQLLGCVWLFVAPWTTACQPPLFSPGVGSNPGPSSLPCYLTFSFSTTPLSFCLQSFPASGSFPISWFFASGGPSIEVSASGLPTNTQCWFPLGLTDLTSTLSQALSRVFSRTIFESLSSLALSRLYDPSLISVCDYWENHSFDYMDLCWESDVTDI